MAQESHDQNFKNLFLDFPREALAWILPQTLQKWGVIRHIEFVRQEPKKRKLSDAHLNLDMPILFSFEQQQVLLWLVEFQEDKAKFSIYTLLRYTTDLMEAYPQALVIPTVLFTDRTVWRKDVLRHLDSTFENRNFLHFEYVFVKLFDLAARDYYHYANPVVKILLPKMHYAPKERWEVIRQAYMGLFELVSLQLFEKYCDFIDVYAQVRKEERETIYQEIQEHQETLMIAQLLKEEGKQQGLQEGKQQGLQEGKQQGLQEGKQQGLQEGKQQGIREGNIRLLSRQLAKKYRRSPEDVTILLEGLSLVDFLELGEYMLDCESFEAINSWITQRKQHKAEDAGLN